MKNKINKMEIESNNLIDETNENNEIGNDYNVFQLEEQFLKEEGNYIDSDEDEYYDQTQIKESIHKISDYRKLIHKIIKIRMEIQICQQKEMKDSKEMKEDIDSFEEFMKENEWKLFHPFNIDELQHLEEQIMNRLYQIKPNHFTNDSLHQFIDHQMNIYQSSYSSVPIKRSNTQDISNDFISYLLNINGLK